MRSAGRGALALGAASTVGLGALQSACGDTGSRSSTAVVTPGSEPSPTPVPARYSVLHSRPDLRNAPSLYVLADNGKAAPGFLFLTTSDPVPPGPAIFDSAGRLIWFKRVETEHALNFLVVPYQRADRLAWFEGTVDNDTGTGAGSYVLADEQYREIRQVQGEGGTPLDLHEFTLTEQNTALVPLVRSVTMDLSSRGGIPNTPVLEFVIQEIDLGNGRSLFEWHSLDHISLDETVAFVPTDPGKAFDPFHLNSIQVDTDGNLLDLARNTCSLYKLNRRTGDVMWRIGGAGFMTTPDPKLRLMPESEHFFYQHDAHRNDDGTVSIFDDGGAPYNHNGRGLLMEIDEAGGSARVVKQFGSSWGST